ncbi:unnamed protein product, partial [Prorocentrum cordatum]
SYSWDAGYGTGQFPGDPYGNAMPEVTRSVRADAFPAPGGFPGFFAAPGGFPEKDMLMFDNSLSVVTKTAPSATNRATELKCLERRFIQQATTLELEDMALKTSGDDASAAEEALARWVEFLCKESSAKITKDGAQTGRASVTAVVFTSVAHAFARCTVRAKVYRTACRTRGGARALVLEISRRSGDAVAFFHVFKRASDYLLGKRMTEAPGTSAELPPPEAGREEAPAPEALPATSGGRELQPGAFYSLLGASCNEWGLQAQAEFAELAASLVSTPAGLERLLAALHEVHEALAVLLLSAHLAAAYPAAVAVAKVLASPHAGAAAGPAAEARARLQDAAARAAESAREPLVRAALGCPAVLA